MQRCLAKIGLAFGVGFYVFTDALKLSTPNVFKVLPFRPLGSRLVQIDRNLVPLPDFLADSAGDGHAILEGYAFDRE